MSYPIYKQAEIEGLGKLTIEYDDGQGMNPRETFDNLGIMTCFHSRYNMGDEHRYSDPRDCLERLLLDFEDLSDDSLDRLTNEDILRRLSKYYVIYPIYMYEHSGRAMSLKPFGDRWDSGQVGWYYQSKETLRKELGVKYIAKKAKETIKRIFESEVKTYIQWAEGEIYYYLIEDEDGNPIDDCGGFIGDLEDSGLKEYVCSVYDGKYKELWDKLECVYS